LMGFGRALEFKVDVPKEPIVKAWVYTRQWLDEHIEEMMSHNCCWETITSINYAASLYPDKSWTADRFDDAYRKRLLDYSFAHWKEHSPLLKGYLALTLHRMGRLADAKLVWDSVMDSSKSDEQLGTYWAQEDRSWLWYRDTIESHAFSLRALMELDPKDKRAEGLVQWLFLNKKMNHWKSTRATSEAIYALVHYLDANKTLAVREVVKVDAGTAKTEFVFEPDAYTGKKNQFVIPGEKMSAKNSSKITIQKTTPGFAFASATWHFSTDRLPKEDSGDFFNVSRKYFKRELGANAAGAKEWTLKPLADGQKIEVGDQIEVQISLRTKHEAEYVHLRDPRAAGLEPENVVSGYRYDLGLSWYEEVRDSGSNFFFSQLPVGEYTFKYRLRANMAGLFRIGPATVQSMYAPEFNAYSSGYVMKVEPIKTVNK
jgi:alpha-2-macroglobulin